MGNLVDNKFTWVVKDFTSLQSKFISSDEFLVGGCKWCLIVAPKGRNGFETLSLYLAVGSGLKALSSGWRRHVKYRLTLVNQLPDQLSLRQAEREHWFDRNTVLCGYTHMILLNKLHAKGGGFLVNDQVKFVVEVDVLQVICNLDVSLSNETQEVTQPLKRRKVNDNDNDVSSQWVKVHVNGFQVLPSQVNLAKRVFDKYPEIAIECRTENQEQRTSYITVLLSLIKMLFKSPHDDDSTGDVSDAEYFLGYIKDVGFKLDWLEKKLDQVKETKKKSAQVYEMEQQLHEFELKCKDLKTQINKGKAEILEATASPDDLYFSVVG